MSEPGDGDRLDGPAFSAAPPAGGEPYSLLLSQWGGSRCAHLPQGVLPYFVSVHRHLLGGLPLPPWVIDVALTPPPPAASPLLCY